VSYEILDIPEIGVARLYSEVASTMDIARELAVSSASDESWSGLVVARRQNAGRGRQGRSWQSAGGAFLATYIFCLDGGPARLSGYSLACGVALRRALERVDTPIQLKWPNDLVVSVEGRLKKLGGILIEVEPVKDLHCVLIGVGINVMSAPPELGDTATSVTDVRGRASRVEEVLMPVSGEFAAMHQCFVEGGGFRAFVEEWSRASCFRQGQTTIGIDAGAGEVVGIYEGVEQTGALLLRVNGERRHFVSGHITSITS